MYDILIKNGFVLDGSGYPGLKRDVAIKDGKIALLGLPLEVEAKRVIDAEGLIVAPGFMDIHSHADRSVLTNPKAESAIRQGITFVLGGQCGGSEAPLTEESREALEKRRGHKIPWLTMAEFFQTLEENTMAINLGMLIGQGTVRGGVMGVNPNPPTPEELATMCKMIDQAMQEGAFGLSTGRRYMPGSLASHEEIIEVTKPIGKYDGIYDSHITNQDRQVLESIEELIDVGRKAKVRPHLAHQKVCGKPNWGKTVQSFELMEAARAEGIDILSDTYLHPYTQIYPIADQLPRWLIDEGLEVALEKLKDPEIYARVQEELRQYQIEQPVAYLSTTARGILWCKNSEGLEWLDFAEVMALWKVDYADLILRLVMENDGQVKTAGIMGDEDIARILKHPYSMVGTDSFVVDNKEIDLLAAHPRNYETYPYTIARYVREEKLIDLPTCIRKMTGMVADRLNLTDRGYIKPGLWADITIFDYETIDYNCTVTEPTEYPDGINYVIVNGQLTWDDGVYHDVRAGQVIRNPKSKV
ncbi:MAG: D-aminoacylase [Firmicutes bacterium]|jgi:N-acyl-D-aspartate/D-glutamate deacylase|nr:D-aminoacylase [Bacillota bacterium]